MIPCEYPDKLYSPETRGIVLPDVENRTIVSSFVWTQYRNVTDRRTEWPLAIARCYAWFQSVQGVYCLHSSSVKQLMNTTQTWHHHVNIDRTSKQTATCQTAVFTSFRAKQANKSRALYSLCSAPEMLEAAFDSEWFRHVDAPKQTPVVGLCPYVRILQN